jgi:hypothetical protein
LKISRKVGINAFINLGYIEQGQKEQKLESIMRFKTQTISDLWDEKLLAKGGPAAESVKQKAEIQLDIDLSLNQTIPYLSFLKKV